MATVSYGTSENGTLEICRAKPENRGKGRCTHGDHVDVSPQQVKDGAINAYNEKVHAANAELEGLKASGKKLTKKAVTPRKAKSPTEVTTVTTASGIELKYEKKPGATFEVPPAMSIEGYMGASGYRGGNFIEGEYKHANIAKAMRGDIKAAQAAGLLPTNVKFSVTSPDNSIHIVAKYPDINEQQLRRYVNDDDRILISRHKEISDVEEILNNIHTSYNYNAGNSQFDYFDTNFYGGVRSQAGLKPNYGYVDDSFKSLDKFVETKRAAGVSTEDIMKDLEYKDLANQYAIARANYDKSNPLYHAIEAETKQLGFREELPSERINEIIKEQAPTEQEKWVVRDRIDTLMIKNGRVRRGR